MTQPDQGLAASLALRERCRDEYWRRRDPIAEDRLRWRAQTFRHMVHLLPGQTVLELGCGGGRFTRQLVRVSRGENPVTAVTFDRRNVRPQDLPVIVEFQQATSLPGDLSGRRFDFIVAMDLLDRRNCSEVLQTIYHLLNPGGEVIFYESNPWNVVLKLSRVLGRQDPRRLTAVPSSTS